MKSQSQILAFPNEIIANTFSHTHPLHLTRTSCTQTVCDLPNFVPPPQSASTSFVFSKPPIVFIIFVTLTLPPHRFQYTWLSEWRRIEWIIINGIATSVLLWWWLPIKAICAHQQPKNYCDIDKKLKIFL